MADRIVVTDRPDPGRPVPDRSIILGKEILVLEDVPAYIRCIFFFGTDHTVDGKAAALTPAVSLEEIVGGSGILAEDLINAIETGQVSWRDAGQIQRGARVGDDFLAYVRTKYARSIPLFREKVEDPPAFQYISAEA